MTVSLCPSCNCMTNTIKGNCGKCGKAMKHGTGEIDFEKEAHRIMTITIGFLDGKHQAQEIRLVKSILESIESRTIERLKPYVRHKDDCGKPVWDCSCGLSEILGGGERMLKNKDICCLVDHGNNPCNCFRHVDSRADKLKTVESYIKATEEELEEARRLLDIEKLRAEDRGKALIETTKKRDELMESYKSLHRSFDALENSEQKLKMELDSRIESEKLNIMSYQNQVDDLREKWHGAEEHSIRMMTVVTELRKENDALQKKLDDMRGLVEFLDHLYREVLEGDESKLAKEILDSYRNSDKGIV